MKRKLELKKKVVAALSDIQKSKIMGGGDDSDSYCVCETNVPGDCVTLDPESCDVPCESQTCMSECDLPTCNPDNCA